MDASAIMQNDTKVENMKAMTDACREYGVYSSSASPPPGRGGQAPFPRKEKEPDPDYGMAGRPEPKAKPGTCIPWEEKVKELPELSGDTDLIKTIWESTDALGNLYIWHRKKRKLVREIYRYLDEGKNLDFLWTIPLEDVFSDKKATIAKRKKIREERDNPRRY